MTDGKTSVVEALNLFASAVRRKTPPRHFFGMPSQLAARDAQLMMRNWVAAGESGWPDGLSKGDYRAGVYDLARPASQLRAYHQVISVALVKHAEFAAKQLTASGLMLGVVGLRGFFERAGSLAENVRRVSNSMRGQQGGMEAVLDASEDVARCLYGTRLDWMGLATTGLRSTSSRGASYKPTVDMADLTSKNVLTGIDALEKRVSGARASYEVFCEFLHPNVGDLVATTEQSSSWDDAWGTRHIRRVIAFDDSSTLGQADFEAILGQAFGISVDVVNLCPALLHDLGQLASLAQRVTKKSQHAIVRRNPDLFRRGDPCPCLSGKTIRECAPTALRA